MTIDLLVDPAAAGLAEPSGGAAADAEGDDDSSVSFVDMLGGALAAAAVAMPPPQPPQAPLPDSAGGSAGALVPAVQGQASPPSIVPAPQVSLPDLPPGAAADDAPGAGIASAEPTGAAASAAPAPELPFAEVAAQLSIDAGHAGDAGETSAAAPQITWTATAPAPVDAAATARWAPFRVPRAVTYAASHERTGAPLVVASPGAVPPAQGTPVDGPVDPGALAAPGSVPSALDAMISAPSRMGAALSRLARPAASQADPLAKAPPPTAGGELAGIEAGAPALPVRPVEPPADEVSAPSVHAVHVSAHQGLDPLPADAPLRSDAAPTAARADDGNQLPGGELGHSGARITVGEGDDRVSLLIALRGEHVRVEARAHSAIYADVLHQRADELASGLAERGLVLGSLSTDVSGERAAHSTPHQPDERSGRRSGEDHPTDPEPRPDRPRPRGVRAIA